VDDAESMAIRRRELIALGLITAAAAALRFPTLHEQSFWYDEAVTAGLVKEPLIGLPRAIANSESTPPLYYVCAWLWSHIFGSGEAGLRSLSALVGTATVPVAYAFARTLLAGRAAYVAASLIAFNPSLILFSQEARSYALFVLLETFAFLYLARLLREPTSRDSACWAAASALALTTHYFAVFFAVSQAVWLLRAAPRARTTVRASGAVAVAVLAVAPLAVYQERGHRTSWIRMSGLPHRLADTVSSFAADPVEFKHLWVLAFVVFAAAVAGLYAWCDSDERRAGTTALFLGLAALGLALALSGAARLFAGKKGDFFLFRNVEPSLVAVLVAGGVALGARRLRWIGPLVAAALCGVWGFVVVDVARRPAWQRENWRAVAADLRERPRERAIVVVPAFDQVTLRLYRHDLQPAPRAGVRVREIVVVERDSVEPVGAALSQSFHVAARDVRPHFTIVSMRSRRPVLVKPSVVDPGALLVEPG
jgi:4-amino-4-deoxy-L-arabinose transferase-like glycosyltransferase